MNAVLKKHLIAVLNAIPEGARFTIHQLYRDVGKALHRPLEPSEGLAISNWLYRHAGEYTTKDGHRSQLYARTAARVAEQIPARASADGKKRPNLSGDLYRRVKTLELDVEVLKRAIAQKGA